MIVIMSELFTKLFAAQGARHRQIDKGSCLFFEGDRVQMVFGIEHGLVELSRRQLEGASIVLQRASNRTVLAESSLYSTHYHCDAVAVQRSTVFSVPKKIFLARLDEDRSFSQMWAAHLAREVREARTRCEILSRKTVAERLDGWMVWQDNKLPEKGQWKSVAEEISVSPEALYRELSKRRKMA